MGWTEATYSTLPQCGRVQTHGETPGGLFLCNAFLSLMDLSITFIQCVNI